MISLVFASIFLKQQKILNSIIPHKKEFSRSMGLVVYGNSLRWVLTEADSENLNWEVIQEAPGRAREQGREGSGKRAC